MQTYIKSGWEFVIKIVKLGPASNKTYHKFELILEVTHFLSKKPLDKNNLNRIFNIH